MKNIIATALCLVALAACDKPADEKKPEDKNTPTTTNANAPVTTPAPAAVPAATPVAIADGDLSTPADFEETAEKAITAKNYKAELSTLESE